MKFKLIVFDIDGTLTQHVSSWQYLHEQIEIWDEQAHVYQDRFMAGRISYPKFCRLDAAHWKGLNIGEIREMFKKISYAKNAEKYLKILRRKGFKLAALSTGLQFIADRIRNELGFHYDIANQLLVRGGRLTGGVKINVTFGSKGSVFRKIVKRFKLKPSEVICVGDGEGDISMARLAGYSIAFNSKSRKLSRLVDYNCRRRDFKEVYDVIRKISE